MPQTPIIPASDALPLQAKLQPGKRSERVPSFRSLRRRSKNPSRSPRKSVPQRGTSAPATRDRFGLSGRRVLVKMRIVNMDAYGQKAAALHLRYLDRDGTGRNDEPEQFFDQEQDGFSREDSAGALVGEPHQFRLIISPEDAQQLDLKTYTRELMQKMDSDLGRKLRWQAINHYNTAHPHTHIVIRGLDQKGEEVFIDREYISHGIRNRAQALATQELGLRMEHEIAASLEKDIGAQRFTGLDRQLLAQRDKNGGVALEAVGSHSTPEQRINYSQLLGRLHTLETLQLVNKVENAGRVSGQSNQQRWQLDARLKQKLNQQQQFNEGMQRLQQAEQEQGQAASELLLHTGKSVPPINGLLLDQGLTDELSDQGYRIVGDQQGKLHHIAVKSLAADELKVGQLVTVKQQQGRAVFQAQHPLTLPKQIRYAGRTYLDQHYHALVGEEKVNATSRQLKVAALTRGQWLQQQGLEPGTQASRLALDERERQTTAKKLGQRSGLAFHALQRGESFRGEGLGVVSLPSGRRYSVVGNSKEFAMVPWQPERDREQQKQRGQAMVIGINRDGRAWTKALDRGLAR